MVVCFGLAWPSNLMKSWRVRTTTGKSIIFLFAILLGYLSGITYKLQTGWDWVSWFYLVNTLMVGADVVIYFRNRKFDLNK